MRAIVVTTAVALAAALAGALPTAAARAAEPTAAYVSFGRAGQGVLWRPAIAGDRTRIGLVLHHHAQSSLGAPLCGRLAQRGFATLCVDAPRGRTAALDYETSAAALRAAVARLREEPGLRAVALLGHGEGGAPALFYQNVARNGPSACQGPEKIVSCDGGRLANLIPADAVILIDPDLGQAFMTLSRLDPAILTESAPTRRDARLDLYDPRNGFDPGRNAGDYPAAFRRAYFAAQAQRKDRLVEEARKLLSAVATREPDAFSDDMPLFVAGARGTPIWQIDPGLLARTRRAHTALLPEAGAATRLLESRAAASGAPREAGSLRAAASFTAREFLANHAIATTPDYEVSADDVRGVVWASSITSSLVNAAGVRDPLLVVATTGHHAVRPSEMILDAAASHDKDLVGVEGAGHGLAPCNACVGPPVRHGDTFARALDHMEAWLLARF